MLAIPLITLQVMVEVAIGGFIAIYITDLTRLVTRGFIASTGVVILVIGIVGLAGERFLPDPSHLTDHVIEHSWITPSLRLLSLFIALFAVYLIAVYLRPFALHIIAGGLALLAGLAALTAAALTYPTPLWGAWGSVAAFLLSAVVVGTVVTAMLLGHWYLVVPNLSTRPLFILMALIAAALAAQLALDAIGLLALAGHNPVAARQDVVVGGFSLTFWMHLVGGILLPALITALSFQSTRLRSLMSATGLLYVAVVLVLVGSVTGRVIFFSANLPI